MLLFVVCCLLHCGSGDSKIFKELTIDGISSESRIAKLIQEKSWFGEKSHPVVLPQEEVTET